MGFVNSYDTTGRAEAYSKLEFSNTYHLAFCDLPELIHVGYIKGSKAARFWLRGGSLDAVPQSIWI